MTELLAIQHITKAYPGVVANENVSFNMGEGEVHALLGENGAGKSTLVKMIYGLVKPDSGTIKLAGKPYQPTSPSYARQSGVAMVFQHFSLFEAMSVAENIALGMENPPEISALENRISEVSQTYGLPLEPARIIAHLSAGERQRVEIIRCLLQNPRLLIMDEPTSVLTPQEVQILFTTLRQLSEEGTAILYISHKLNEIRELCDQATILRGGKVVGHCDPKQETAASMAELMVGKGLAVPEKKTIERGEAVLALHNLSLPSSKPFGTALKNINFELHQGEILGIGGVAGNGQDELLSVISGESKTSKGSIFYQREDVSQLSPNQRRRLGLVAAPEERLGHAAVPVMSLLENSFLTAKVRQGLSSYGFIAREKVKAFTDTIIEQFGVKTAGAEAEARSLSGGNLQKFVIGREVLQSPEVIIVNQPTWGVDAAAATAIHQALKNLAEQGAAVVAISQDLDELMVLSDRFAVLAEGCLSEPVTSSLLNTETIGLMMGGQLGLAKTLE